MESLKVQMRPSEAQARDVELCRLAAENRYGTWLTQMLKAPSTDEDFTYERGREDGGY